MGDFFLPTFNSLNSYSMFSLIAVNSQIVEYTQHSLYIRDNHYAVISHMLNMELFQSINIKHSGKDNEVIPGILPIGYINTYKTHERWMKICNKAVK